MSSLKERVLQLPLEKKIELLEALKQDLQWVDDALEEDELSPADWAEIKKREVMIESGQMKWIGTEEFDNFLRERRNITK